MPLISEDTLKKMKVIERYVTNLTFNIVFKKSLI